MALDTAVHGVDRDGRGLTRWSWLDRHLSSGRSDTLAALMSGTAGGAAGIVGTMIELPVTTTIIMRSIAQTAQLQGEDIETESTKLACLQVFALGGPSSSDDNMRSSYYALRLGLAEALGQVAGRALNDVLPVALAVVAARFGLPVTWKISAQAVPITGAAMGGLINLAFIDHYQSKALGHFIVRRLERAHGENQIKACYEKLRAERAAAAAKCSRHG